MAAAHPEMLLCGLALLWAGVSGCLYELAGTKQSPLARALRVHAQSLDEELRPLLLPWSGARVCALQGCALLAIGLLGALGGSWHWAALGAGLVALAPRLVLATLRRRQAEAVDAGLDGALITLVNALQVRPGIASALGVCCPLLPDPLRGQIELCLKQLHLGSTLEAALTSLGDRVRCPNFRLALRALLIGRKVGGNLPEILESTASTLREMARLDGVLKTKTAEGKSQISVLAVMPLVIVLLMSFVQPAHFDPLFESTAGVILLCVAGLLWVASLLLARKILSVSL